jgi:hypothetical protein
MRAALSFGVLAVLASPATAEVRSQPTTSVLFGIAGHTSRISGLQETGFGPSIELALGHRRWQAYVEGAVTFPEAGPDGAEVHGTRYRAGLGVRWLARSFELGEDSSLDMEIEGFTGWQHYDFDGDVVQRPDVGVGVGYRIRGRFWGRQLGFRLQARAAFAPADRDQVSAICRGTCTMPESRANSGLALVTGVHW